METKPTYDELEREVDLLRKTVSENEYLERVYHSIGQSIVILDPDQNILSANLATEKLSGCSSKELKGKKCYQVFHDTKATSPPQLCPFVKMLSSETVETMEMEVETLKGTFLISCTPVFDHNSKLKRIVHISTDITDKKKAEERLRESEAKYRALFNNMDSGVAIYRAVNNGDDFIFVDFNKSGEEIDNVQKNELIGKSILEMFPGIKDFGLFDLFQRVWRTGQPERYPITMYKDERIEGWRNNFVYKLPSGEVVAIYSDETASKRKEAALRESEAKFQDLYDNAPDMFASVDSETAAIISCNQTLADALDYKKEEIVGRSIFDVYAPGSAKRSREVVFPLFLKTGSIQGEELQLQRKDGSKIDVSLNASAVRDDQGNILYSRSSWRDISESKQAEEALRENEEKYRTLFESSRDAIMTLAPPTWLFTSGNLATVELFKVRDEAEFISLGPWQLSPERQPDGRLSDDKAKEMIEAAMRNGSHFFEWMHCHSDGTSFPAEVLLTRMEHNGLVLLQATVRDITERKQSEAEQARLQAQLFQAQKMESLGTLVAGMAHEINNPVTSIMLNAPVLRRILQDIDPILDEYSKKDPDRTYGGFVYTYLKDNLDHLLSDIRDGANRIAVLVKRLKAFAKKSEMIEKKPMDLNTAVENAIKLSGTTARKDAIELRVILEDDMTPMEGHQQSIEQIILNLIINAIQAIDHDEGKITVETGFKKMDQNLFVTVSDSGRGIDPSIFDRVFDPFVTSRQSEGGTGLGLSVTYSLVKDHDGEITFQSQEGKGTTFTVLFPVGKRRRPAKILVVEDEPEMRRLLVRMLTKDRAYMVQEAVDGIEALIKMGAERPDLLILDIMMPNMDGLEVCKAIKKSSDLDEMDIIIVTGFPDHPKLKKIADLGFTDIYPKPFHKHDLIKKVDRILEKKWYLKK